MIITRILIAVTVSLVPAMASAQHAHDSTPHDHRAADVPAKSTLPAPGGQIATVDVLGVVCDFCATALTKNFERRAEVAAAHVDLDAKTLTLAFKPGRSMSDAQISELVTKSGYKLSAVHRSGGGL